VRTERRESFIGMRDCVCDVAGVVVKNVNDMLAVAGVIERVGVLFVHP
jgi:hypothetical protein